MEQPKEYHSTLVLSPKLLILQRASTAGGGSNNNYDSFHRNYESKLLPRFVDGAVPHDLESRFECQRPSIFARPAAALVVVVHACALARGGC
jgi:hypothetical protein